MAYFYLIGLIVTTALGQFLYKLYFVRKDFRILIFSVLTFLAAPVCSYLALHDLTIGTVYMSTALIQIAVLTLSKLFLKEHITRTHILASAMIVSGIVFYNL